MTVREILDERPKIISESIRGLYQTLLLTHQWQQAKVTLTTN